MTHSVPPFFQNRGIICCYSSHSSTPQLHGTADGCCLCCPCPQEAEDLTVGLREGGPRTVIGLSRPAGDLWSLEEVSHIALYTQESHETLSSSQLPGGMCDIQKRIGQGLANSTHSILDDLKEVDWG